MLERKIASKKEKQVNKGTYYNKNLFLLLPDMTRAVRKVKFYFDSDSLEDSYIIYKVGRGEEKKKYLYSDDLVKGYYGYEVLVGGYGKTKKTGLLFVHRLIYFAYYDEPNELLQIHHIDGNRANNSPLNLVALTSEEHAEIHGHMTLVPGARRHLW